MMPSWEAVDELADGPGDSGDAVTGTATLRYPRSDSAWMTTISTGEASER